VPAGRRAAGEVAFSVALGSDGGFVLGRAGDAHARRVDITFPNGGGTLSTAVGEERFFLAALTPRALDSLMITIQPGPQDPPTKDGGPIGSLDLTGLQAIAATARDAAGAAIARGHAGLRLPTKPP
jgi:hypothetical protein